VASQELTSWADANDASCAGVDGGCAFRGRGPLRLRGRANYAALDASLQTKFSSTPDQIAYIAANGFRVAGWQWIRGNGNGFANVGDYNGLARTFSGGDGNTRVPYLARIKACLSSPNPTIPPAIATAAPSSQIVSLQQLLVSGRPSHAHAHAHRLAWHTMDEN
jgi:hypothetical protein